MTTHIYLFIYLNYKPLASNQLTSEKLDSILQKRGKNRLPLIEEYHYQRCSYFIVRLIAETNTRISSESFSPPLHYTLLNHANLSLCLSFHTKPPFTRTYTCARVSEKSRIERVGARSNDVTRSMFHQVRGHEARSLSLSLSSLALFFLPVTCATTRRRNERSTPVNQRWRAGAFPIRASINEFYYPRVGVLEKIRFTW